ncbi:alpha/beta fold hydrolase [Planomonospora venezuelensis]|uniref:Pimeloyl-ACP methyl ester carboxylesterase n=1 Tax=Planomonospora venezuelensis TaxID=1999 RepID=A0A841CRB8_PLAVE|nr:alpha/beta fold hydrolase [Planomonospora venezuelensis]MBB5960982.1 pimeloyl-ACP methyl ester carboxylesterase [Planomonospora venezuelensis]GIN01216.1 alpha/beta hydrolase [Planomonospora venezuelensis]
MKLTARGLRHSLLVRGPVDGPPVLLVHGNCSSGAFWEPLVRHLPAHWRIVAPDLRGYGETDTAAVDATRGLRDFADDLAALLDAEEVFPAGARPVVVGHSMGGGVAMQLLIDAPDRIAGLVLEAPLSPHGFGLGGAGAANPEFVERLAAGDRGADSPASPRTILRTYYVADPASLGADEEMLLDTVLSTAIAEGNYPGDAAAAEDWPGVAAGKHGVLNAMSPRWFDIADDLVAVPRKPKVTWVRGDGDQIVSDASLFDLANLGSLGVVPGWPGEELCPPQPMVAQTRAVLERYAAAGGSYEEVVYTGVGHSPHIERAEEFARLLRGVVDGTADGTADGAESGPGAAR